MQDYLSNPILSFILSNSPTFQKSFRLINQRQQSLWTGHNHLLMTLNIFSLFLTHKIHVGLCFILSLSLWQKCLCLCIRLNLWLNSWVFQLLRRQVSNVGFTVNSMRRWFLLFFVRCKCWVFKWFDLDMSYWFLFILRLGSF